MTVDPKQVKDLVTTFCELDEEYREKALRAVNKVFLDYICTRGCEQRNIPVTKENQSSICRKVVKLFNAISDLSDTQEASVAFLWSIYSLAALQKKVNCRSLSIRKD